MQNTSYSEQNKVTNSSGNSLLKKLGMWTLASSGVAALLIFGTLYAEVQNEINNTNADALEDVTPAAQAFADSIASLREKRANTGGDGLSNSQKEVIWNQTEMPDYKAYRVTGLSYSAELDVLLKPQENNVGTAKDGFSRVCRITVSIVNIDHRYQELGEAKSKLYPCPEF